MIRRAVAILCIGVLATRLAQAAAELPASITHTLDAEYPGWNLAPVSKLLVPLESRDRYTNLIYRDLDADGDPDYAITINYLDSQNNVRNAAIAFVQRGGEFREYTLIENYLGKEHRLVYAPGDTVLHWVRQGDSGYQVKEDPDSNLKPEDNTPTYPEDAVEVINFGKAVTVFYWDGSGFQRIRRSKQRNRFDE